MNRFSRLLALLMSLCLMVSLLASCGGNTDSGGSTADAAGTCVHGIFVEEDFRDAFLGYLASRKGIRREDGGQSWKAYKEEQMKILSSTLRKALDMDTIYRLVR